MSKNDDFGRKCKYSGKPLPESSRADKVFFSAIEKSKYHNEIYTELNKRIFKKLDSPLHKSWFLIDKYYTANKIENEDFIIAEVNELKIQGWNPQIINGYRKDKDGNEWWRIYDHWYSYMGNTGKVKIIKEENYG